MTEAMNLVDQALVDLAEPDNAVARRRHIFKGCDLKAGLLEAFQNRLLARAVSSPPTKPNGSYQFDLPQTSVCCD